LAACLTLSSNLANSLLALLLLLLLLAAGLPKFRGFDLRSNPAYPNTAAWFAAISARPAYQKVCSDDQTLQLLFQRMMGLTAGAAAAAGSASASSAAAAAAAAMAAFSKADSAPAGAMTAEDVQKARTEVRGVWVSSVLRQQCH
jgi:uncharacterized membrane protein YphA (DoxX/SURF4 family)